MRLNDLVFISRTIAQVSTKYGSTYCSVFWSDTLRSLVRIYPLQAPLPASLHLKRWHVYSADLSRPRNDHRAESWHLDGELTPTSLVVSREEYLDRFSCRASHSVASLNDCKRSLGIVRCSNLKLASRDLDQATRRGIEAQQCELFRATSDVQIRRRGALLRDEIGFQPMLQFSDESGDWHEYQLLSICSFALLAKGYGLDELRRSYCIGTEDRDHLLLIGNQANHLTSWLTIEVFPVQATRRTDMQMSFSVFDHSGEMART